MRYLTKVNVALSGTIWIDAENEAEAQADALESLLERWNKDVAMWDLSISYDDVDSIDTDAYVIGIGDERSDFNG